MANTVTVNKVEQGNKQFQGAFSEMWFVTATMSDQDAVAIGDTAAISLTVPGVALGDMAVGWSLTTDTSDGTDFAIVHFEVSAANTLQMRINADAGELAADSLNGAVIKVLVGRPAW